MAKAFTYKKTLNKKLSVTGNYDLDTMTIVTDEGEKSLKAILEEFAGFENVTITLAVKDEEELDEPMDDEDSDDLDE